MNILVGKTPYLNAFPFYNGLQSENGYRIDYVEGAPSALNEMVRKGKIQISLISSLEYSKAPDQYFVLPGISIAAREESQSVGLVWKRRIEDLAGREIFFVRDSFTSVALLDILLKEKFEIKNSTLSPADQGDVEKLIETGGPLLVIGDLALALRRRFQNSETHFYDLGTLWWEWLKMPFCFALWVVRKDFYEANREQVNKFISALKDNVQKNLINSSSLSEDEKKYILNFDYGLDLDILQGLFLFYERAAKLGWTKRLKNVEFAK